MAKLLKCIVSAAMAGVMTMSFAVSASAANTNQCKHSVVVLRRTSFKKHVSEMHQIHFVAPNGEKIEEWCNVSIDIYERGFFCNNCNVKVYDAPDEEEKKHYNPHCMHY